MAEDNHTHLWVQVEVTPIEVELQEDRSINIYTTELAEELAKEDPMMICWTCGAPLTVDNLAQECIA